jgi:hypothetical protein
MGNNAFPVKDSCYINHKFKFCDYRFLNYINIKYYYYEYKF